MAGLDAYGIGGQAMQAQGFRSLWPMETLSVRGYVEALRQLPAILRLRSELVEQLLGEQRPDLGVRRWRGDGSFPAAAGGDRRGGGHRQRVIEPVIQHRPCC